MKVFRYAIVLVVFLCLFHFYIDSFELPEFFYDPPEVQASKKGYTLEKHFLTTPDNYLLQLFRLSKAVPKGPPVLLVHGMSVTAESFMMNLNAKPPAYKLVDEGFDVWLLNTRGNTYSRNHTTLGIDSKEFWSWTAAEISNFDLPSSIEYVKKATNSKKIGYVGHAQGATLMLLRLAIEKRDDIAVMVSIGGSGKIIPVNSIEVSFVLSSFYLNFLEWIGVHKIQEKGTEYTTKFAMASPIMYYYTRMRYDYKRHGDDRASTDYYVFRLTGGVGVSSLRYYSEVFKRGALFLPDYGKEMNMIAYNSENVPHVDMKNIETKIALFGGKYDARLTPEMLESFYDEIDKGIVVYFNSTHENEHAGFLLSGNQQYMNDIVRILKEHLD